VALLPFAQLDVAGAIAIADGRYLARPERGPDAGPDVLVVRTLGAARSRSRLRRGRPVALETGGDEPTPLQLTRLTLIKAIELESEAAAAEWLKRVVGDEEIAQGLAREVTRTCNRALLAHRVAAPDPYASDLRPADAVVVRFGYGSGDEVADGRWQKATELPERARQSFRARVIDSVGAQERIAGVLGGRDEIAPHESLLIDAERAAEQGRYAIAALTLGAALDSLVATGAEAGAAAGALRPLRDRALGAGAIDTGELAEALKLTRRAIRAASAERPAS
jgi:hypothetical protein